MRLQMSQIALPMLCACALAVSACTPKERLQPIFPPSVDLKLVISPKPKAGPEIVTSAQAAAEYDIAVETWGDTVSKAGQRICRWAENNGAKLDFVCPKVE